MKTNLKLLLLVLLLSTKILAQNPAVILTPNYIVNYPGYTFSALPIGNPNTTSTADPLNGYFANFKAKKSQNIQVDAQGKILFFIVDGYIFGRSGQFLGQVSLNIDNVYGSGLGYADGVVGETMVIPSPNCTSSNVFHLITSYTNSPTGTAIDKRASYDKLTISYDVFDNLIPGSGLLSTHE